VGGSEKSQLMCCVCVIDYAANRSATVAFHNLVWQHYSGEVGKFIIF